MAISWSNRGDPRRRRLARRSIRVRGGLGQEARAWSASATRETTEASIDAPIPRLGFAWGHLVYVVELPGEAVLVFDTATGRVLRRVDP